MCMHLWGDDWEYWDELSEAMDFIQKKTKKYSGCSLMFKEKYGTIRYEFLFPPLPNRYWGNVLYRTWLRYGKWVLRKAVASAVKRFPNVREEILADWDNGDYL